MNKDKVVIVKDKYQQDLDLSIAMESMDRLLLYEVYLNYKDCSPQKVYDQYCRLHRRKYREDFDV